MAVAVTEQEEIPLTPVEQIVNELHDRWVASGMDGGEAARRIRVALAARAVDVQLSEEFWSWLGS